MNSIWTWHEKRLADKYYKEYEPVAVCHDDPYRGENVSIIVPTIDTEDTFTECLRLWLANRPKEIIIVTIPRDLDRVKRLVKPITGPDLHRIQIRTVAQANKREQMARGIKLASGSILALVDDDTFWPTDKVLPCLLAPFKDENVGAVGGPQA